MQQAILLMNDLALQMQLISRPQAWGRASRAHDFWAVLVEVLRPLGSFTYGAIWEIAQDLSSSRGDEGSDSGDVEELHVEWSRESTEEWESEANGLGKKENEKGRK